ncbi:hypothetical protein EYZ11_007498 [Aspergillus tanneri]|uniref:Uncharacterized protein n=1 Tax=Aspergillus tanneri TaxID=1220188 RepID=A0A4S3JCT4_9EURO|nr:hypothetical protein EYZ11_007498 [Aspergillus tanneri]
MASNDFATISALLQRKFGTSTRTLSPSIARFDGEAACGPTWGDFHACCPHGSTCPGANTPYVNSVCCPSKSNCTELILDPPVCADRSWTLYDHEGYFCCHKDMRGFFVTDMSYQYGHTDPDNGLCIIDILIDLEDHGTNNNSWRR